MTIPYDEPPIEPLMRTWKNASYAGSWTWTPATRPASDTPKDLNPWARSQLQAIFEAFDGFARLRSLLVQGPADGPQPAVSKYSWNGETPHSRWLQSVLAGVASSSAPITAIEAELDLHVWVETRDSDPGPRLAWVASLADLDLAAEAQNPYGCLWVHHTLFRDGNQTGESNAELHRLNQPLLREGLRRIAERVGPITDIEGVDVCVEGFHSL